MSTFDHMLYSTCVQQVIKGCGELFARLSRVHFGLVYDVVYNSVLAEDVPRYEVIC